MAAEQISQALQYLTNSDFLYATVFVKGATDIVKEKNIAGVTVPSSKFLDDPDLASKASAQEIIAQLKSTGSLQAVHGVAVAKVVAQPDDQQIKNGQTYNLTASDQLTFQVTVENQGNMAEKDVPVVVTLGTESGGEPQKITVTIPEIKGGEQLTAEVTGLNPTDYGEPATLTVEVGPVPGEKVTDQQLAHSHRHLQTLGVQLESRTGIRSPCRTGARSRHRGGRGPLPGLPSTAKVPARSARHPGIAG